MFVFSHKRTCCSGLRTRGGGETLGGQALPQSPLPLPPAKPPELTLCCLEYFSFSEFHNAVFLYKLSKIRRFTKPASKSHFPGTIKMWYLFLFVLSDYATTIFVMVGFFRCGENCFKNCRAYSFWLQLNNHYVTVNIIMSAIVIT